MTESKYFLYFLSVAYQVEPETSTSGGGEQGASEEGVDPVLGHRSFLARQHLGVVATLEPARVSAVMASKNRTVCYCTCQILATRCTRYLREEHLHTCVRTVAHWVDIIFVYLIHVQFYFFTLISFFLMFCRYHKWFSLNAKHDLL